MTRRMIGCVRRAGRWYCHTASDLLAVLGLVDDGAPIDCDQAVPADLIAHLETRGVRLAPGTTRLLHIVAGTMPRTEAQAVHLLRRALRAALPASDQQRAADA